MKNSPSWQHEHQNNASAFQFSEASLRDYLKEHRRSLKLEKVYTAPKYEWIPEDHTMQVQLTKAQFRSTIYPDITADSQIDIKEYLVDMKWTDHDKIKERICDRLASSGHRAVEQKELLYKAAVIKKDLKASKQDFLKANDISIREVKVESLRWQSYVYYVSLDDKRRDVSAMDHGKTPEEAFEKTLRGLDEREKQQKEWIAKMRKEQPDYMYVKTEYEDRLKELWYVVFTRYNSDANEYSLWLAEVWNLRKSIDAKGTSREEAFTNALQQAEHAPIEKKKKSEGYLDVTHLSAKSINALFDSSQENPDMMHEIYTLSLYDEIRAQIESGEVTFGKAQLEEYKQYCIDTENYEMALKVKEYLENLDN